MSEWLIHHFISDVDRKNDTALRAAYGKFAGVVGIFLNILLCAGKGIVGLMAGSVSIVADAINNLADASSNVISLIGFKLAELPADPKHPYGHGRFEYLSGLAVSVFVVAIGIELVVSSTKKILHPTDIEFTFVVACILIVSIIVKLWMAAFNRRLGIKIGSDTLIATAVDSRNDAIATTAVLIAGTISYTTDLNLDGWMGLATGLFIIWSGYQLIAEAISPLLGQCPSEEMVAHIHDKIMSYPGVLGTHDLMVHDYGPGRQFVSAHVEMAAEADPLESHDLIDNIEQDFKEHDNMIVTLHYDPIVTDDPEVKNLRNWISQQILIIDERLTIHDLRIVPGTTHTNVLFDCVVPQDLSATVSDDEIADQIACLLTEKYPQAIVKITIDHSYVSAHQ